MAKAEATVEELVSMIKSSYTTREADDIANLAFIGGKTNRQISDQPPSQYFPRLIEKSGLAAFQAQCIPTETRLLEVGAYKLFLSGKAATRRRAAQRISAGLERRAAPVAMAITMPL